MAVHSPGRRETIPVELTKRPGVEAAALFVHFVCACIIGLPFRVSEDRERHDYGGKRT